MLVEDIIKLSQLDEGRITEKKEQIDLYLLCQKVLSHLDKAAEDRKIQLKLIGESLYIEAVMQVVEEMIYNLCDNAIKYNREGGSVTVSVMENDGFYRVNKSHSKEIGGTGLGLSIVKHGAAYHEAQVQIESRLGVGTHISIQF